MLALLAITLSSCNPGPPQSGTQSSAPAPAQLRIDFPALPVLEQFEFEQAELIAGSGEIDFANGAAATATFSYPYGLLVNEQGSVWVADRFHQRIRQLQGSEVNTLAGQRASGLKDGIGAEAQFDNPQGLAWGPEGSVYVADTGNHALRQVFADGRVVTLTQELISPVGLTSTPDNVVYIADAGKHQILKYQNQQLTVVAGSGQQGFKDGPAAEAQFFSPRDLVHTADGNLYVVDTLNQRIRKITPQGQVETFAGNGQAGGKDGKGTSAIFNEPVRICLDRDENMLIVDFNNRRIRRLSPAGDVRSLTIPAEVAKPQAIALNPDGLWVADSARHQLWILPFVKKN